MSSLGRSGRGMGLLQALNEKKKKEEEEKEAAKERALFLKKREEEINAKKIEAEKSMEAAPAQSRPLMSSRVS